MSNLPHIIDYDKDQLSYALANALKERDEWAAMCGRYKQERDEAREDLEHVKEYGTEEINAAVELRQKLAQALIERDEAREYSKATWQGLRDSQDEVLRLTFENRELRNLKNE